MNIVQAVEAFTKGQNVQVLLSNADGWTDLADCTLCVAALATLPHGHFRLTPKHSITIGKNVLETNDLLDITSLENGMFYYIPSITNVLKYEIHQWNHLNETCRQHLNGGLVFKTKETAILATECLLDAVQLELYNA